MRKRVFAAVLSLLVSGVAVAQGRPDPSKLIAAQQEAMRALAAMDGVWRGPAWTILPDGSKHELTQTERVGPFLDGSVKVIEGRGYEADGRVGFNAFAVVSYDVNMKKYSIRSHAMGQAGDFSLEPTENGFVWTIPAGPAMTLRYTATVKDGTWREIGERIVAGKEPVQFFEMNLKRIGDSDWPAGGAVSAK